MSKKSFYARIIIVIVMIGVMLGSFVIRVQNESRNKDVKFALSYNDSSMILSTEEFDKTLKENKKMGVNTLVVEEDSINSLISAGHVTGIKYNVLCHKYDDESEAIIKQLAGNKKICNDSYVLISKRPERKAFLQKWISAKYDKDEYVKITTPLDADVYVLYEGVSAAWKIAVGFQEEKLAKAYKSGFDIVLSMMVSPYSNTEYIDHIAEIIDKYDVKYINLKKGQENHSQEDNDKKNYKALCKLIKEKELYLILTENQDQLSNQKPIGYAELISSAGGRVLRGYETIDIDNKNTGATIYEKRYYQILNSVIDRNIRFVRINQLTNGTDTFGEKSEKTNLATKKVIAKLNREGFNTQSYDTVFDYNVSRRLVSSAAMIIMIIMALTMLEWLFDKHLRKLEIVAAAGAVLSVGFTYLAPEAIVLLYPTLFALIAPCFAITAVMVLAQRMKDNLSTPVFVISMLAFAFVSLVVCAFVQTTLLSGLDYYLNSIIFRGIKLSLIVPIAYTAIAYTFLFKSTEENLFVKMRKFLNAEIKVYWMIISGVIVAVAAVYLIRSGNVSTISPIENFMRNTITDIMTARPRTKEFLIGWPCLVLLFYYIKNYNITIIKWCLCVGSSILFASVINTFCHVFTSAGTMYQRTVNGLITGMVVSVFAVVINAVILRVVKEIMKKGNENG